MTEEILTYIHAKTLRHPTEHCQALLSAQRHCLAKGHSDLMVSHLGTQAARRHLDPRFSPFHPQLQLQVVEVQVDHSQVPEEDLNQQPRYTLPVTYFVRLLS